MKKFILTLMALVLVAILTACTEEEKEQAKAIGISTVKSYAQMRPELKDAYARHRAGDINKSELIAISKKFGHVYVSNRLKGEKDGNSSN